MPGTHAASNPANQGSTKGGERGGSTHDTKNTFGPGRSQGKSTHPASNDKNAGSSGGGRDNKS